jgi:hypothetical protein
MRLHAYTVKLRTGTIRLHFRTAEVHMKTGLLPLTLLMLFVVAQSQTSVPKKVLIKSKWYSIYTSLNAPELLTMKWGVCNCKAAYIQIDPDETDAEKRDTVWHEINHALNDCDTQFTKYVDYDNIFSDMIPAQLQVLRDNPTLVRFLVADSRPKSKKIAKAQTNTTSPTQRRVTEPTGTAH